VSVHVFGIRHHGPGSARSLLRALESLAPDLVLVEGPPEADALLSLAAHAEMQPPVALLVYDPADPRRAVHYPFATYSPEWQAIRYALARGVPVRFCDLPMSHQLVPVDVDPTDGSATSPADGSAGASADGSAESPADGSGASVDGSAASPADGSGASVDGSAASPADGSAGASADGSAESPADGSGASVDGSAASIADGPAGASGDESAASPADGSETSIDGSAASAVDGSAGGSGASVDSGSAVSADVGPSSRSAVSVDADPSTGSSVSADSIAPAAEAVDPADAADRSTESTDPSAGPASADGAAADSGEADEDDPEHIREDPLNWLARAAGESDGERWWEQLVEHRRDDADLFQAVLEAMDALRGELALPEPLRERRREAYMRQQIRAAEREGHARIAVVCGAWHAPALVRKAAVRDDAALLKGLPKARLAATWVPWTYGRLASDSGYGAGVTSPGWYDHLWETQGQDAEAVSIRWLTRAAQLLREQDLSASTAQVIDAARLAGSVAALRGLALPGLAELNQAADAVFWGGGTGDGGSLPLRLIHEHLVVAERLGAVPAETPAVPLQQDLAREQKRLRLPPEAGERVLELDLRRETDLHRSRLLHRLRLLGLPWGDDQRVHGKRGTFHEHWRLRWHPEFAVRVIEAAVWGNTVAEAAGGRVRGEADRAADLPALTGLLQRTLLADLPAAARHLIARIDAEAARAADLRHLMGALPPLAEVLRYGDVRGTDTEMLGHVVDGLVARIAVGLPLATASLDDEAAAAMAGSISAVQGAVTLLQDERHRGLWADALRRVADGAGVHGHVQGRVVRLLLDLGSIDAAEAGRRLGLALSTASAPELAGAWVEGFLAGSGLVLLHDARLFGILDGWLAGLGADAFTTLLPLLRRTFSTFAAGERRGIGELARRGGPASSSAETAAGDEETDRTRAAAVLPLITLLMGLDAPREAA
jgi:hypothetical protein